MSAALAIKNADGTTVYLLMQSGAGSSVDPYIPSHTISGSLPAGTALIGKVSAQGADAAGAAPTANPLFIAWDGTNVRAIKTDNAGVVQVAFAATPTVNLGTIGSAATAANQATANTSLASIDSKLPASPATAGNQATANTSLASIDGKLTDVATQTTLAAVLAKLSADPASQTTLAAILAKLIAAPATEAKQDSAITALGGLLTLAGFQARVPTNGQKVMSGSLPVVIASDQGALPVSGTFYQATQPVSLASLPAAGAGEAHIGEIGGNLAIVSATFARPADTTAYTANDTVSDSTSSTTPLALANAARVSGGSGYITEIAIATNLKSITPRLRVHIFNTTGATLAADNVAYKALYTDVSKRVGSYDMPALATAFDTTNSDMSGARDNTLRIPYACAATSLYVVLETLDAFTPASGQSFTVTLKLDRN